MLYLNYKDVTPHITKFPDGTTQVWKLPHEQLISGHNLIEWEFESDAELMPLVQLVLLLNSKGIFPHLMMSYPAYGRQDKEISNQTTFGLHALAHVLNSLDFKTVNVIDPHSKEYERLIKHCLPDYKAHTVQSAFSMTDSDIACYPDNGALEKYIDIHSYLYVHGEKIRDAATGFITKYELKGDPSNKRVLIIDDICDGGATFVELSQLLYEAGATEVNLYVSHGIFSRGTQRLFDAGIKRIFTYLGEVK